MVVASAEQSGKEAFLIAVLPRNLLLCFLVEVLAREFFVRTSIQSLIELHINILFALRLQN